MTYKSEWRPGFGVFTDSALIQAHDRNSLKIAINEAFKIKDQIVIEEFIQGQEIVVGVYRHNGKAKVLPITEVKYKEEFHTYQMKWQNSSQKSTPANFSPEATRHIKNVAEIIYDKLGCKGPARYDLIWQENTGKLFFLELNEPPTIEDTASITQQVWASGLTLREFLGVLVEETFYDGNYLNVGDIETKANGFAENFQAKIKVAATPNEKFDFTEENPSIDFNREDVVV